MSKDIEIELKFQLLNPNDVEAFLQANGTFQYKAFQHDVYYNPPHRDFLENPDNISEWLRIRVEPHRAQINYKDWHPREKAHKTHCTEYETSVESYEQLSRILGALDFKKLVEVKKTRKAWLYMDTEVSIDSVEELGDYLEVEYKGTKLTDVDEVWKHLYGITNKLGAKTNGLDRNGYPLRMLQKDGLT